MLNNYITQHQVRDMYRERVKEEKVIELNYHGKGKQEPWEKKK